MECEEKKCVFPGIGFLSKPPCSLYYVASKWDDDQVLGNDWATRWKEPGSPNSWPGTLALKSFMREKQTSIAFEPLNTHG